MSDKSEVDLFSRIGRAILGRGLDIIIYTMLGLSFKIFFNIASAELFTNETIKNFVGRVQLVIGVFMMFKLAVAIVKGIIDPDSFMDKKGGVGNLVTRVIFALVMLTLVVPINIPNARNEYEVQLNNNGLLFGTLYSLQNRVLSNNTLGHLILGTTNNNYSFTTENGEAKLEEMSNMITSTVLKAFVKINVKDESLPETDSSNWLCEDLDSSLISTYTNPKSTTSEILDLTKETCDNNILPGTGEVYAFSYLYFASGIAGVIFVVLMVGFSIDVAKRAIKLAVLRLIAPIPIISYIDPSTQKKSFDSWVSAVISTYIDLFVRLALVYFVIFLISDIVANGLVISEATGMVGGLTVVFIFIGLFYFAKEAPKFFMDLFGIKGSGGKMFGGFGEILGVGAVAAGAVGSTVTGFRAGRKISEQHQGEPIRNFFRTSGSTIAGALGGGAAGVTAALSAKDHKGRAAFEAMQKRNALAMSRASSGSTFGGRLITTGERAVLGQSSYEVDQANLTKWKGQAAAGKDLKTYLEEQGVKKGSTYAISAKYKDSTGAERTLNTTYDNWASAIGIAKQQGQSTFTVDGHTFQTYSSLASKIEGDLKVAAGEKWAQASGDSDAGLQTKIQIYKESGSKLSGNDLYNADTVKKEYQVAENEATKLEKSAKFQQHKANHGETGGKK